MREWFEFYETIRGAAVGMRYTRQPLMALLRRSPAHSMQLDILKDSVTSVVAIQHELTQITDELKNIEIDEKPMTALDAAVLIEEHLKVVMGDLKILKQQVAAIRMSIRHKIKAAARQEADDE